MRILRSKAAQTEKSNPLAGESCHMHFLRGFPYFRVGGLAISRAVVFLLVLTGALLLPLCAGAQSTGINELDDALEIQLGGHLKEAIQAYTDVIKNHPRSAEAFNWRGMAYEQSGDLDKALADFNQAVDISPNYADAYNNRGEVYRKKKMYPQAVADYQKAVSIEPTFAEAYYNLGLVFEYGLNKSAQAAGAYENYLKNEPQAKDGEAVSAKIKALKAAAVAKPAAAAPATPPKPGAPGVAKPEPGKPQAQAEKPPTAGAPPPGQRPPAAQAPGARPGERPGQKPGQPSPRPGMAPPPAPPGLPLPVDIPFGEDIAPIIAVLAGMGIILVVVPLVFYIFFSLMLFLIAKKTNTGMPWMAFIPIAQYVLMLNIAGRPIWWIVAFLMPMLGSALSLVDPSIGAIGSLVGTLISMVAWLLVSLGIASARGKSLVWGVLLFVPCTSPVALVYLGVSK